MQRQRNSNNALNKIVVHVDFACKIIPNTYNLWNRVSYGVYRTDFLLCVCGILRTIYFQFLLVFNADNEANDCTHNCLYNSINL